MPTGVCIATRTTPARLVTRPTLPGTPIAYPLLVVDKCPWTPPFTAGHAHIHYLVTPGERQFKVPSCARRPYMLTIGGPA